MIKIAIFDIDNTLYDYDTAHTHGMQVLFEYCKQHFGLDKSEVLSYYHKAWDLVIHRVGTDTAATHSRMLRFQCMIELLGQPLFPHTQTMYHLYWDAFFSHMNPSPGISDLFAHLKQCGIRIGIGTDMTAEAQYRKLNILGLSSYIDMMVTSEEAGAEKPHPRFFKLCVEKSHCQPDECLFIGDNIKKDVEGAISCGLHGIWYSQGKTAQEALSFPVILSFEDIISSFPSFLPR